mmetsp:Transcript_7303/g.24261  ORF Transcript_7303/g.24261 Transcript_7303/m.24261 type:complete len:226 (-) Transcript_7303:917-1594(-)
MERSTTTTSNSSRGDAMYPSSHPIAKPRRITSIKKMKAKTNSTMMSDVGSVSPSWNMKKHMTRRFAALILFIHVLKLGRCAKVERTTATVIIDVIFTGSAGPSVSTPSSMTPFTSVVSRGVAIVSPAASAALRASTAARTAAMKEFGAAAAPSGAIVPRAAPPAATVPPPARNKRCNKPVEASLDLLAASMRAVCSLRRRRNTPEMAATNTLTRKYVAMMMRLMK